MERFQYDPSKPIEPQIRAFLNGRNPYGTMKDPNWFSDPSLYTRYAEPDESGTLNYGYRAVDPRLSDISRSSAGPEWNNRIIDGQYTPVGWSASNNPDAINGLKPDSMYDYGQIYYDPQFGLIMPGSNVRDPDARHDAWYGAALMSAVAAPAIAGILGGAGAGAGGGGLETMSPITLDPVPEIAPMTGAGGSSGMGLLQPITLEPVPSIGTMAELPSTGGGLLSNVGNYIANNPMNAARFGMGLYQMATANNQHPGQQSGGGGGGLLGPVPQFNPLAAQGPFQMNPYLAMQMRSVPFMGGSYAMGF